MSTYFMRKEERIRSKAGERQEEENVVEEEKEDEAPRQSKLMKLDETDI